MFYQNLAFRRNSTVCMGFYFLWSHVPFEYISSSMSPPLHCESARCVLQMLDVEVSSVAEIRPDVICGPADVPVWASVRSFLENGDFHWNQSWHLKYLLGGGIGLGMVQRADSAARSGLLLPGIPVQILASALGGSPRPGSPTWGTPTASSGLLRHFTPTHTYTHKQLK